VNIITPIKLKGVVNVNIMRSAKKNKPKMDGWSVIKMYPKKGDISLPNCESGKMEVRGRIGKMNKFEPFTSTCDCSRNFKEILKCCLFLDDVQCICGCVYIIKFKAFLKFFRS
jgi:hypothetical protein